VVLCGPDYDGLRVTFDLNPLNTWAFNPLPRDLSKDNMHGYTFKDDLCATGNKFFRGKRYAYQNDTAAMLLFDVNGYIAGIQAAVPKSILNPSVQMQGHPAIDAGDDLWTFTIYFVDPSIICSPGRTAEQYATQGTGTGFWIQNGTDPVANSMQMPHNEADLAGSKWLLGHCIVTMGNHYWYNPRTDQDCDEFFPFFLLYNKGRINAGGFSLNRNLQSRRWEHPPLSSLSSFMKPVPKCFGTGDYTQFSSLHVWLTDWPRTTCLC